MAVKYLDNAGTQYLVNKIKAIDGKIPTESQITTMITSALNTYKEGIVTIVESLPQTGEEGKLYLMVDPSDSDVYIIYTWEENAFKRMGSKTFTLTVDSALSSTSTNPVQNKVIKSALDGKANSSHTHGSITNDGKLATASRVVITGTDKKIGISTVTTTQLGYLSGVTSAIQTQLDGKSATGHTHTAGDVAGLATVATSGSYNDLSNKPTINDSTITIQKNGSLVGTFTVNGSAKTIDIPVPTKTSDLTNDSNFVDTSNSAVASGITATKVTSYDSHVADTDIHVTTADKTKWNNGVSQSYVLRYSSASVTDNSTIAYSTLDNTDNVKSGDKVIDVDGKIFSVVSVDTANQTVTVGSALIDLALDANVVHTSGNETVGGQKTFSDNISIYNSDNSVKTPVLNIKTSKYVKGDTTNTDTMRINFLDSNGNNVASVYTYKNTGGSQYLAFQIYTTDNNNANITSTINYYLSKSGDRSFVPYEDNQISLGGSVRHWKSVYATNYYYGSNNIEFSTKFVTTDTNQTIAGGKTFSSPTRIYNASASVQTDVPSLVFKNSLVERASTTLDGEQTILFTDKNDNNIASIQAKTYTSGISDIILTSYSENDGVKTTGIMIRRTPTTSKLQGYSDNITDLGDTNRRWRRVYATSYYYGSDNVEFSTKFVTTDTNQTISGNKTFSSINGVEPSSLSLPTDNVSNIIDISSYMTILDGSNANTYQAPGNGYISITMTNCSGVQAYIIGFWGHQVVRPSIGGVRFLMPIRKNMTANILIFGGTIDNARFIPCQGNV